MRVASDSRPLSFYSPTNGNLEEGRDHVFVTPHPSESHPISLFGIPNPRKGGSVIGADRQRVSPSCVFIVLAAKAGPRVPSGGVTLKRCCTYRPSVIYLIVNKLLSLSPPPPLLSSPHSIFPLPSLLFPPTSKKSKTPALPAKNNCLSHITNFLLGATRLR